HIDTLRPTRPPGACGCDSWEAPRRHQSETTGASPSGPPIRRCSRWSGRPSGWSCPVEMSEMNHLSARDHVRTGGTEHEWGRVDSRTTLREESPQARSTHPRETREWDIGWIHPRSPVGSVSDAVALAKR